MTELLNADLENYDYAERHIEPKDVAAYTAPGKPHLLIMLHGIRTYASWMEDFLEESIIHDNFKVEPVSYGNIPTREFLFHGPDIYLYKDIIDQIRGIIIKYPEHDISIMCHSFGTKLFCDVCRIIDFKFRYVILLASLASADMTRETSHFCDHIVSDHSKLDLWPTIAGLIKPKAFQGAGTHGYNKHWVRDRRFAYFHSDYLTKKHFMEYILPILISNVAYIHIYKPPADNFWSALRQKLKKSQS